MSEIKLRPCQKEAHHKALNWWADESNSKNFIINAAPGAGKTLCATFIAKTLLDNKFVDQVVVIAPRSEVVKQWTDDFKLVTLKGLQGSFNLVKKIIFDLQQAIVPISKIKCEPQLSSKKNLLKILNKNKLINSRNILNFLQYCDGKNNLEMIAKNIKLNLNDANKPSINMAKNIRSFNIFK